MKCEDCLFWNPISGLSGQCRRHAPKPIEYVTDDWPNTAASEWCGDFQPKEEATTKEQV